MQSASARKEENHEPARFKHIRKNELKEKEKEERRQKLKNVLQEKRKKIEENNEKAEEQSENNPICRICYSSHKIRQNVYVKGRKKFGQKSKNKILVN